MKRVNLSVILLLILGGVAVLGVSASSQSNLEALKKQNKNELLKKQEPQPSIPSVPDLPNPFTVQATPEPAKPQDELGALREEIKQLKERVNRLEGEIFQQKQLKIIPLAQR